MVRAVVVAALAGCSFSPNAPGASSDAPPRSDAARGPDGATADAPPTVESCMAHWHDHTVQFGTPVLISELTAGGLDASDPFVTPDERTIYFGSYRTPNEGGEDIWTATRTDPGSAFGSATPFYAACSSSDESKISFTDDGSDFVVTSTRSSGTSQLFEATNTGFGFVTPPSTSDFPMIDNGSGQLDPAIGSDGLHLFYSDSSSGVQRIAAADRDTRGDAFGAPHGFPMLDSGSGDADPTLSPDQSVIVFSTRRDQIANDVQIYYSTRAGSGSGSGSDDFEPPLPVPGIDTPGFEGDPELSSSGCHLYFASTRDPSNTKEQIYVASMLDTP